MTKHTGCDNKCKLGTHAVERIGLGKLTRPVLEKQNAAAPISGASHNSYHDVSRLRQRAPLYARLPERRYPHRAA